MPDVLAPNDPFSVGPGSAMVAAPDAGAPAPVPPTPGEQVQQRYQRNLDRQDQMIDRLQQSSDRQDQIAEDRSKALAPLRQKQMDLANQKLPSPPQQKQPPAVPQRNSRSDDEDWLQAAMLLGALAGGFTRRHMTNALGAMQGAIEGYQEGSRQKFDQNMKIWDAENKKTIEANKVAMDHYTEVLQNRKLNLDQMSMELQMAAAQYDDKAMAEAAKSKNTLVIAQLYDKQAQSLEQFTKSAQGLATSHAEAKQREMETMAHQYASSPEGAARAAAIAVGRLPPLPTSQRTGFEGARNVALMDKVLEINPAYDARNYGVGKIGMETPARAARAGEVVRGATDARAAQRTVIAFDVGPEARSVRSLNVAIDHLGAMQQLADHLQNRDINAINSMKNWLEKETGSSAPTNFDAAKQIIAQEVVKSVVANGGSMQERREAAEQISSARSPEQIKGIIEVYKRLMAGQLDGLKGQYEEGTKRNDFDNKLRPHTKAELQRLATQGIPDPPNELKALIDRLAGRADRTGMGAAKGAGETLERASDTEEFQPRELLPNALQTPEWLRNKVYTPPAIGAKPGYVPGTSAPDMPLPPGWTLTPMP